jgi:hypothetical protein
VQSFVKRRDGGAVRRRAAGPAGTAAGGAAGPCPACCPGRKVDFAKFGPVERKDLVAHQEDQRRQPAPQLGA